MKAMIFAAGLGTRLRPITETIPKAVVEFKGKPLIENVINRLITAGVTELIVNLHHFPEQIKAFVKSKNNFGIRIEFSEEIELLDTGGGLKKAGWFFNDGNPFILHNVDILSDIDLNLMVETHNQSGVLSTVAVKKRATSRYFIFDQTNLLCGWKSVKENKTIMAKEPNGKTQDLAFCGIHVISPQIFPKLTETGKFSIVESYLRLAREGERIAAFRVDENSWQDIGKVSELPD